ncbi:amidohydrolase [Pelomonas sp. KK5]|uniref:amidohydrolase family protein n=1 Tax=Pelomonas sp. KK5 TaxID=1855730 RepID=UPI00097C7209|nr:amidohydrolase family protein [Pelomonas sp. KK5]
MSNRRQFNAALLSAAALPLAACVNATPDRRTTMRIDCHAHVFTRDLPMPDRRRAPAGYDARPEDYLQQLDANGMTHGVLVQPSFLGTDNSYLVATLRRYPDRLRGIAVVEPTITAQELQALQEAGVVGIRLNLVGLPTPDLASGAWRALLAELKARQWQVEVHQEARELPSVIDPLMQSGVSVVVDHFGRPDAERGIDDPGFRYLLGLGATRRVWVKLSGAYRNGSKGRGEATALAAMPLLRSAYGLDRLIWGSDWPHTLFEKTADYMSQRRLLDTWLPDSVDQQIVLGQTPARLYRFA